MSFDDGEPGSWNWIGDPLQKSNEQRSFYVPLIADPVVGGAMFVGMESVWRTQHNGGDQAFLEEDCNEYTGTFQHPCGDWKPIGSGTRGNLTSTFYGRDKLGHYVVAVERSGGDTGTLWAGTRIGRVFVSTNANAPAAAGELRPDRHRDTAGAVRERDRDRSRRTRTTRSSPSPGTRRTRPASRVTCSR